MLYRCAEFCASICVYVHLIPYFLLHQDDFSILTLSLHFLLLRFAYSIGAGVYISKFTLDITFHDCVNIDSILCNRLQLLKVSIILDVAYMRHAFNSLLVSLSQ